jgi:hypothetical protein
MKRPMILLLACTVFATPSLRAHDNNKGQLPIRIFVFTAATNPSGFVDSNHKDLTDSVSDLRKDLKSKFTLVDDRATADVSVEIVGRGYVPTGALSTITHGFSSTTSPNSVAAVRATLSAGDYSTTIDGISDVSAYIPNGTWRGAAWSLESQIDKWVRNNYEKLMTLRTK